MTDIRPLLTTDTGAPAGRPARVRLDESLVRAHQASLWRYVRVLGARPDTADDLVQEAFVVLLRSSLDDRGPAALRTWLRRTVRNLFLAQCRQQQRAPVVVDNETLGRAWASYEADDDGAGYRAALERCLETLPGRQHALLEIAMQSETDLPKLAAGQGLSLEAARSQVRRIKQALRDCVQRRLSHDS